MKMNMASGFCLEDTKPSVKLIGPLLKSGRPVNISGPWTVQAIWNMVTGDLCHADQFPHIDK